MLRYRVKLFFYLVLTVWITCSSVRGNSFTHASADWNVTTGGVIFSSPAIAHDGSVYIGSNDNKLHAFNADGTSKWTFTAGNWVDSTPAIGSDGTVYVGSWDNKIYALNAVNGDKLWEYETNSYIIASPSVGVDGKIYVGSKDSIFYALESNGSVAWEYFAGQPITSSAAIGQDGTIYFGDENGTFHAVKPDGSLKWTYSIDTVADTNKSVLSSPALDLSGNLYFGAGNGYCYSLSDNENNASLNWKFLTGDRVDACPVLGLYEEVFFVSRDGYIRSLSTLSGGLNWDAFVGDVFYSSPVVDENGRTYVIGYTGGGQNHLFAFDANGSKAWDTNDTNCPFGIGGLVDSSLALSSDGKLYYGCFDNRLYCLNLGVGPAASDWPMFQRSSRRDGAWPSFLLEILVSPSNVATASGGGIYNQGATATISLNNVSQGYSFNGWSGGTSGSSNPINLTINSNISITAHFNLNQYALTVNAGMGGSVSGNGTFTHGATAPITATPEQGYSFSNWSGQGITNASAASTTVSMTDTRTVTATFAPLNYSISTMVSPSSTGEISGGGNYQFGNDVILTATATSAGYSFLSWSGDLNSTVNPLSVKVDANLSLTANFSLDTYSLELISEAGGTVAGSGNFAHGTLAVISATPSPGYFFSGWSGTGIADHNAASTTAEMTGNRTITASFSLSQYSLHLLAGDGGTVTGEGNYSYGSNASISATPGLGYTFSGWSGVGVQNPNTTTSTISMIVDTTVTAIFSLNNYYLDLNSTIGGTVFGEGHYKHGEVVSISASPEIGYQFEKWSGELEGNLSSPTISLSMDSNKSISAHFVPVGDDNYVLTILSNPQIGGSSTGSGSYSPNDSVPISAVPFDGYEFISWSGTDIQGMDSPQTIILIPENLLITANFQKKKFTLQINQTQGGVAKGGGNFEYGTESNISAVANEGYNFSRWNGNGISNLGSANTTVMISEDRNISAVFTPQQRSLTLPVVEGGEVKGSGIYSFGSEVEISAIPQPGYSFINWSGASLAFPDSSISSITLTEDTNITARFERIVYTLQLNSGIGGTVSGGGKYYYGYFASISATPENGYQFLRWEGNSVQDNNLPFTTTNMTTDRNLTAVFELIPLSKNLENTSEIAPDWFNSSWFGTFFQNTSGWAFHLELAWIYPVVENQKNIWFWHFHLGWVWASQDTFPHQYLWSQNSKNWLWWERSSQSNIRFYDYSISDWLSFP